MTKPRKSKDFHIIHLKLKGSQKLEDLARRLNKLRKASFPVKSFTDLGIEALEKYVEGK